MSQSFGEHQLTRDETLKQRAGFSGESAPSLHSVQKWPKTCSLSITYHVAPIDRIRRDPVLKHAVGAERDKLAISGFKGMSRIVSTDGVVSAQAA
jgi:hypothetical protein